MVKLTPGLQAGREETIGQEICHVLLRRMWRRRSTCGFAPQVTRGQQLGRNGSGGGQRDHQKHDHEGLL